MRFEPPRRDHGPPDARRRTAIFLHQLAHFAPTLLGKAQLWDTAVAGRLLRSCVQGISKVDPTEDPRAKSQGRRAHTKHVWARLPVDPELDITSRDNFSGRAARIHNFRDSFRENTFV